MSINKLITGKGLSEHQSQNIPKKAYPKSQLDSSDLIKHYTEESFFVVDADLKIITFSEKFQEKYTRYLGRDIIKGQNILSYAPTMRLEIAKNIYKQVLQGQTLEVEVALPGPDNTIYSTINKYKPIYDNQKHIIGVFVACSDITPTRKAQNETQKSEENYRAIVENSVNAFFFSDHDGSVIDVNDAAVKMFGYSVVEIKRLNRNDLIDHTDSKFVKDLEEQEKTGSMKGEAIGIRKNGENFAVEISSTFYKDFNNEIKAGTFINDISARKKAERRVELNEKRFRSLVENSTDMLILSDKDDVIEYVSPAFEKLTGYEPSEVIGKRNLDFLHPEQAEEIKEITQKLLENPGISIPRQNRIKHKGGHFIWIEGCVKNLLLDENVHAIVSNYYDITERLKAAEELRRSENSLKTIFENTTEAFLLIDGHGKVKAFNSNARIFAFLNTPNEIEIGQDALNFIADDRKEVVMALFEKAFAGEIIQFDRLYEKEDSKTWIDFSIRPVVEDDIITGVCVTGVDITGRKKAEEELRKRELRFRSILENSHDMLFLFDADGKVEFLSPAIEKAFGYTNGEEEIHHILDSIHPEDLQYTIEQLRHVFESPEVPVSMTFRKKKRAGSYIWLEGTLTNLLHIPDINVVVANFTDITERKHFEENQALYVSIVNLSEDAIFSQSLENKIITWNKGASKLFGFSADEVLGNDCHLIIPQNRLCEEDEIFEKIKQGISVENFETQGRKKNGELIYISLTVSPIRDSKGNIKGASKIARDISDKKRAEDAISNNEKRFRSLLQNSNDGLSLMSIDGVMLEISPAGKKITGFDEHEMIGQARYDLIHPDDLQD
ncbi:MAG TPA: PAS domain S-box protein, partial [Emticicia sp.]